MTVWDTRTQGILSAPEVTLTPLFLSTAEEKLYICACKHVKSPVSEVGVALLKTWNISSATLTTKLLNIFIQDRVQQNIRLQWRKHLRLNERAKRIQKFISNTFVYVWTRRKTCSITGTFPTPSSCQLLPPSLTSPSPLPPPEELQCVRLLQTGRAAVQPASLQVPERITSITSNVETSLNYNTVWHVAYCLTFFIFQKIFSA